MDFVVDGGSHVTVQGADGAYHGKVFGDDVVAHAGIDLGNGHNGCFFGKVGLSADDGLQAHDDLGANHHGIYAGPGREPWVCCPLLLFPVCQKQP